MPLEITSTLINYIDWMAPKLSNVTQLGLGHIHTILLTNYMYFNETSPKPSSWPHSTGKTGLHRESEGVGREGRGPNIEDNTCEQSFKGGLNLYEFVLFT